MVQQDTVTSTTIRTPASRVVRPFVAVAARSALLAVVSVPVLVFVLVAVLQCQMGRGGYGTTTRVAMTPRDGDGGEKLLLGVGENSVPRRHPSSQKDSKNIQKTSKTNNKMRI